MAKEKYVTAELDVHVFEAEDVIMTSGNYDNFDPDPHEGNPVGG